MKLCRARGRFSYSIFWKRTLRNIPDRQQYVYFRVSLKVLNLSPLYCTTGGNRMFFYIVLLPLELWSITVQTQPYNCKTLFLYLVRVFFKKNQNIISRAGHATTLPRQRNHVFRIKMVSYCIRAISFLVWIFHLVYLETETLIFFLFLLVTAALTRCREVGKIVACPALVISKNVMYLSC